MILSIFGYLWVILFRLIYYTPAPLRYAIRERLVPPMKLLRTRFVSSFLLGKVFLEPVWYFVTFWLGRYLVDVFHWDLKKIGFYAVLPFLIADAGNICGGYFTQWIIRRGTPIPRARKLAVVLSGLLMGLSLLLGPLLIGSPISALILLVSRVSGIPPIPPIVWRCLRMWCRKMRRRRRGAWRVSGMGWAAPFSKVPPG